MLSQRTKKQSWKEWKKNGKVKEKKASEKTNFSLLHGNYRMEKQHNVLNICWSRKKNTGKSLLFFKQKAKRKWKSLSTSSERVCFISV
jgi:hypothetical protein